MWILPCWVHIFIHFYKYLSTLFWDTVKLVGKFDLTFKIYMCSTGTVGRLDLVVAFTKQNPLVYSFWIMQNLSGWFHVRTRPFVSLNPCRWFFPGLWSFLLGYTLVALGGVLWWAFGNSPLWLSKTWVCDPSCASFLGLWPQSFPVREGSLIFLWSFHHHWPYLPDVHVVTK